MAVSELYTENLPGTLTSTSKSKSPDTCLLYTSMANPVPEIMPDVAKAAGARVVGTGRSDFPNQINNAVAFPGIFKGALEGRATPVSYTHLSGCGKSTFLRSLCLVTLMSVDLSVRSVPSKRICPDVGVSSRLRERKNVD